MDIENLVKEFLATRKADYVIAFSGGSEEDEVKAREIVRDAIIEFQKSKISFAVLAGGTIWSVPRIANDIAIEMGIPTIGVLPERGKKYLNKAVELPIIVSPRLSSSEWGDDSEVFAKLIDGAIIVGGSYGTLIEFSHISKINEGRLNYGDRKVIYFVPICGLGGISELAYYTLTKKGLADTIPSEPIFNGINAAKFLIEKLEMKPS